MKRLLLGDTRQPLLETIEGMLKHWGYRVLVSSRPEQIKVLLRETSPDLLILGAEFLANSENSLRKRVEKLVTAGNCPLLVLNEEGIENNLTIPMTRSPSPSTFSASLPKCSATRNASPAKICVSPSSSRGCSPGEPRLAWRKFSA